LFLFFFSLFPQGTNGLTTATASSVSTRSLAARKMSLLVSGGYEVTEAGVVPESGPHFIQLENGPLSSSPYHPPEDLYTEQGVETIEVPGPRRPSTYRAMI
jgi:hypothetical protein